MLPTEPLDPGEPDAGGQRFRLLVWEPAGGARERVLEPGVFTIGRLGADVDIEVDDPAVSRVHARLFVDEQLEIEDAGSFNGTFVARQRIAPRRHVSFALEEPVVLGGTTIVVRRSSARPEPAPESVFVPAKVQSLLRQVAGTRWAVLIVGETGTGKTRVAADLHAASGARGQRFVVSCRGASEERLVEGLFGADGDGGAWTRARGGTLVIEDVTEMPMAVQARLVGRLDRPDAEDDPRVVATSRVGPAEALRLGILRKDLRYRLGAVTIVLPPLRDRSDTPAVAGAMLDQVLAARGLPARQLSDDAYAWIAGQAWPGNLHELASVLRAAALTSDGGRITVDVLEGAAEDVVPKAESERERVVAALAKCAGNQSAAARLLGISRGTLVKRIRDFGIARPRKR